jgi:hypothetical protein
MSDAIDGAVFEETMPAVEPADAFAGEAAPEILVERGDELRLRDFFALRLWPVALIPLLFTAFTSNLTAVRVADAISPLGRGAIYEDLFFQPPSIPLLARHLLPFGLPLTTETGYGYGLTNILQSNMLIGLGALLIGILLASAVTRRTNDAIYVAGPYFVYSAVSIALLWKDGKYFQGLTDAFPAVLGALLAPLLVGLIAKVIGTAMRNQGWLEADGGMYLQADEPALSAANISGGLSSVRSATAVNEDQLEDSTERITVAEAIGDSSQDTPVLLRHVALAKACPFCGNPKITPKTQSCGRCHRNIKLAIEHDDQPCPHCGGALVTGAEFCHHCTMWLKAAGEPVLDDLGVA